MVESPCVPANHQTPFQNVQMERLIYLVKYPFSAWITSYKCATVGRCGWDGASEHSSCLSSFGERCQQRLLQSQLGGEPVSAPRVPTQQSKAGLDWPQLRRQPPHSNCGLPLTRVGSACLQLSEEHRSLHRWMLLSKLGQKTRQINSWRALTGHSCAPQSRAELLWWRAEACAAHKADDLALCKCIVQMAEGKGGVLSLFFHNSIASTFSGGKGGASVCKYS